MILPPTNLISYNKSNIQTIWESGGGRGRGEKKTKVLAEEMMQGQNLGIFSEAKTNKRISFTGLKEDGFVTIFECKKFHSN